MPRPIPVAVLCLLAAASLAARPAPTPSGPTVGEWLRPSPSPEVPAGLAAEMARTPSASPTAAVTAAPAAVTIPAAPLFLTGTTAAAYQVDEHIWGHENHVVGMNQAIRVSLESKAGQDRVVVTAPNDQFKTDSSLRDGRVAGHLGGAKRSVELSSAWFPAADLDRLERGASTLPGEITVKGKSVPVTLTAQGDGAMVRVDVSTSFDGIGLPPPSLGPLGMLGEVHQPLTLSAQIQLKQVEGLR
jgi:hypothetical protein